MVYILVKINVKGVRVTRKFEERTHGYIKITVWNDGVLQFGNTFTIKQARRRWKNMIDLGYNRV